MGIQQFEKGRLSVSRDETPSSAVQNFRGVHHRDENKLRHRFKAFPVFDTRK